MTRLVTEVLKFGPFEVRMDPQEDVAMMDSTLMTERRENLKIRPL